MNCFIDNRSCGAHCRAWRDTLQQSPCVFVNVAHEVSALISLTLKAQTSAVKHPVSAPPPEVR